MAEDKLATKTPQPTNQKDDTSSYDVIVVGGGPAGLTAALYVARAGKKVLVLEGKVPGGQIVNTPTVDNYPGTPGVSGVELTMSMQKQVQDAGGELKLERVTSIKDNNTVDAASASNANTTDAASSLFTVKTDSATYTARAVILATGAENRKLGLPREEELTGRGVSYCATCDGNFFRGKDVAVVGGGNTALEDAVYLSALANKVYLVHRRDEFRGDAANVKKVKSCENIELVLSANATEILGDERVEGLRVRFNNGAAPAADSATDPATERVTTSVKDTAERDLKVDGIFFAIGYVPQNSAFADLVDLDSSGYIETKDGVHTSHRGVYVAGDARAKDLKQLTTAVSDGAIAATTAVKEIE